MAAGPEHPEEGETAPVCVRSSVLLYPKGSVPRRATEVVPYRKHLDRDLHQELVLGPGSSLGTVGQQQAWGGGSP